jgi:hypothetical protein
MPNTYVVSTHLRRIESREFLPPPFGMGVFRSATRLTVMPSKK